jgi:outer membrane receptor for Fe3+-dicitrate
MENENINVISIKNKVPSVEEFIEYANLSADYKFTLTAKYEQWKSDGWQDGNGKKIKNWKTKLKSTIPYLRPFKQDEPTKITYLND